jgi:cytochrome bd-type quinol oxidase subunit 1
MKTLFLILDLLTDSEAIRSVVHACFTAAVTCVGVLSLLGAYQVLRRSLLRRDGAAPSGA